MRRFLLVLDRVFFSNVNVFRHVYTFLIRLGECYKVVFQFLKLIGYFFYNRRKPEIKASVVEVACITHRLYGHLGGIFGDFFEFFS